MLNRKMFIYFYKMTKTINIMFEFINEKIIIKNFFIRKTKGKK